MVSMRDLFPDDGPVSKAGLRRHLAGPVANVQGFGARGDDAADDTPAIQKAIDHVQAQGGGVVYLPAGTYRIMPQRNIDETDWPGASALTISLSNVTLMGDGPALTRLRFRTRHDGDPTDGYQKINWRDGNIWRGTAIYVRGGTSASKATLNTVIADLEIDGGAYPGNTRPPMRPKPDGAERGWDISHKGILLDADRFIRGVVLRNLHVHNFRGELIYGGGIHIDDVLVENCHLHSSVADGISISASQTVRNNRIEDIGHACVESYHYEKEARYVDNLISGANLGINLQTEAKAAGPTQISGNVFMECEENGILFNIENGPAFISGNLFIDCGYSAQYASSISIAPGGGLRSPTVAGIVVSNNTFLRKKRSGGCGIMIACHPGRVLRSVLAVDNFIGSDAVDGETARFAAPIAYAFEEGARVEDVRFERNIYFHTRRHVENAIAAQPEVGAPMPLMHDNIAVQISDRTNSTLVTDGRRPSRLANEGPVYVYAAEAGADPTPVLAPEDYQSGQVFLLVNDDARRRVYFPQSSELYTCPEGRYLLPGMELRLRCEGARFIEESFRDLRAEPYAEVSEGEIIACAGHHECYLAPRVPTRFTGFDGIGHGARVRVVAAAEGVSIAHNDRIRIRGGADLALAVGEVAEFARTRDGILRQL